MIPTKPSGYSVPDASSDGTRNSDLVKLAEIFADVFDFSSGPSADVPAARLMLLTVGWIPLQTATVRQSREF